MINYTPASQLTLSGFFHLFDQELSPENCWLKLAQIIPWDALAAVYSTTQDNHSADHSSSSHKETLKIDATVANHKIVYSTDAGVA
ncbi:MAG: IS5 family transposase [Polaribacter sp.]|jgi:IS5 family transposase